MYMYIHSYIIFRPSPPGNHISSVCHGLAGEEDLSLKYVISHSYTAQLYMQIVSSLFVSVDDASIMLCFVHCMYKCDSSELELCTPRLFVRLSVFYSLRILILRVALVSYAKNVYNTLAYDIGRKICSERRNSYRQEIKKQYYHTHKAVRM